MIADFGDNSQNKMMINGLAENFECKECKKTFKYDSHYKRHIQTHSDTRPFECEVCGKKFKRQDALKTHERTHSDDLPFKCSQEGCIESFASKAALRYHELRHTNETVFICEKDGCNKKFLTLGQLKQHQRTKIHAKSSGGAGAEQSYADLDSQIHALPVNNITQSLSNSGNLSTNSSYAQNQIYYNSTAPCIQFSQPQHFYNLQNQTSPNFLSYNNANLIQSMSDYVTNETYSTNSRAPSQNNISSTTATIQPIIHVKKEHRQEETFLDEFSEDEQVFIDQIWSTIKQEGTNNECEFNKSQDEFNNSCNNDFHNDYPIQKCRKVNPTPIDNKIAINPSTSNLLMEFTRLNSSGYSFSRLKQELRIIVGLIDKIKKEDEEIVPPAPQDEENQEYNNYSPSHQLNNSPTNNMNTNNLNSTNKTVKQGEDQDYHFYQNDESPFHNYECQYIQNELPSEVIEKFDKEDSNSFNNLNGYNNKTSDRPLLKKKIKTAVRLVQYCKKVFIEQKKQQIQQEQGQLQTTKKRSSTYSQNQYAVSPVNGFEQLTQFDITPKYEEVQLQQKSFDVSAQFTSTNNAFSGIQCLPAEDYYQQQVKAQSKNSINSGFINRGSYSTANTQQQSIFPNGFNQQSATNSFAATINTAYNNGHFYNAPSTVSYSFDPYKMQQQQIVIQDNSPICINSLNNTVIDSSQRNLSDIDSIHSNDIPGNIFDAADEQQNNLLFNEDFMNINQFLPPQQFNNSRYTYEQR